MTRSRASLLLLAVSLALVALPTTLAQAAGEPSLGEIWVTDATAGSASFHGEVNPEDEPTTYRFEYATAQAFGEKGFNGAAKAPAGGSAEAGSGTASVSVSQHVSALKPATLYHYRLSASNDSGEVVSADQTFTTQELGNAFSLPDGRGWELVSPVEKNGGSIQAPGGNHGGGVLEAAAGGPGEITYSSASSFGGFEALGAPPASQYVSRRTGSGWTTENITTEAISGSYGNEPNGVPYQLFSPDLARGVMLNGVRCRGEGSACPVANPPLPGSEAPAGYQDYYLRDEDGGFQALLTDSNSDLSLSATKFSLAFAGASPDLRHVVLSTCAALTPGAFEEKEGEGCNPNHPNLYEWSAGALTQVNFNESEILPTPPARLAAQSGAISVDGRRVYFNDPENGHLFLREAGSQVKSLAGSQNEAASFQAASADGSVAFFTEGEDLYRYSAQSEAAEPLATEVKGVLGASEEGSVVYYQTNSGLYRWAEGTATEIAAGSQAAQQSDWPPTTGTARVSADGGRLLFLSRAGLTGYDNTDAVTGQADSEVFLWSAAADTLSCLSCNPTNERPIGPSTIPGAYSNGSEENAALDEVVTDAYKPRNLSADADRVFFDSGDSLVSLDTNKASDVYQWEAQGTGSCAKPGGCLALISSGTDPEGASFVDATESGDDAYFLTSSSLVGDDPGSRDVYDARVGGGFPVPTPPIPCEGDACAPLPSPSEDPTVGTLVPGAGDPPVHFAGTKKCPQGQRRVVRDGKARCVAKKRKRGHGKGKK